MLTANHSWEMSIAGHVYIARFNPIEHSIGTLPCAQWQLLLSIQCGGAFCGLHPVQMHPDTMSGMHERHISKLCVCESENLSGAKNQSLKICNFCSCCVCRPAKIEPGFQFQAFIQRMSRGPRATSIRTVQVEFYHKGPFKGFLTFGGRRFCHHSMAEHGNACQLVPASTHGVMQPILSYDSETAWGSVLRCLRLPSILPSSLQGFTQSIQGLLHDTDIWPPMYLIFTKPADSASEKHTFVVGWIH